MGKVAKKHRPSQLHGRKKKLKPKYLTRNQAKRKLFVTQSEFRKLCIWHGIHPVQPRKKQLKHKPHIYYHTKDIAYLLHDKLITMFRAQKTHVRKIVKARGTMATAKLKHLINKKPRYSLDHIVRDRFPTFIDALRDMDDALTMIHTFQKIQSLLKTKSLAKLCADSAKLAREFQAYVAASHSLKKVFVTIKGIYYQAEIFGQTITWLCPLDFQISTPKNVQMDVLSYFLEFHIVMMRFVNYRLYKSLGLQYPPALDTKKNDLDYGIDALLLEPAQVAPVSTTTNISEPDSPSISEMTSADKVRLSALEKKLEEIAARDERHQREENTDEPEEQVPADDPGDEIPPEFQPDSDDPAHRLLFEGLRFYLQREVPKSYVQFVIKSFGGLVSWEGGPYPEDDQSITHQIVDRPASNTAFQREYLQPQWIFDSINAGLLLPVHEYLQPTSLYAPAATLPPHLSPFVDDQNEGYIPKRRKYLDNLMSKLKSNADDSAQATSAHETGVIEDTAEENLEELYEQELLAEQSGIQYSSAKPTADNPPEKSESDSDSDSDVVEEELNRLRKKKLTKEELEDQEADELARIVLPNSKRRMLRNYEHRKKILNEKVQNLVEKRKRADAEKKLAKKKLKTAAQ